MTAAEQERLYAEYHGRVLGYIRARVNNREDAEDLSDDELPEDGILQAELLDALAAALEALPEELTDIIVLRYYDRLPLTEVALRLGMSYGAVKLRHQKSLTLLKRKLADF